MRWFLAVLAWLVSLAILATFCFFAIMSLAGPHGGILPAAMEPFLLLLCWAIVLVVPVLIARSVWRRVGAPGTKRQV